MNTESRQAHWEKVYTLALFGRRPPECEASVVMDLPGRSFEPVSSPGRTIFASNDSPAGVDVKPSLRIATATPPRSMAAAATSPARAGPRRQQR
jgi:hypothetical protein